MQDASLQESMGPIQDHAKEKLLPTDRAIVMARRMLYEAAVATRTAPSRRRSRPTISASAPQACCLVAMSGRRNGPRLT